MLKLFLLSWNFIFLSYFCFQTFFTGCSKIFLNSFHFDYLTYANLKFNCLLFNTFILFVDFHTFSHIPKAKKFISMLAFISFVMFIIWTRVANFVWLNYEFCTRRRVFPRNWQHFFGCHSLFLSFDAFVLEKHYYSTPCATSKLIALSLSRRSGRRENI